MSFGPENKICESCGSIFYRRKANTWAYWAKAKFCSSVCFGISNSKKAEKDRMPIEQSFSRYVIKSDHCWRWTGPKDKDGYAVFFHSKRQYRAAPFSLKLDGRPVPQGMYACHHCDNPECVRPDHLYPGTPKQNVADMMNRGRAKFGFSNRSST